MQLPSFMGGKPMAREEEDNVRRLRDEQPTRPHRHGPAPDEYSFYTGPTPPPIDVRPRGPTHEIETANKIFAMLKDKEADERRRISEHVAFMMKLYCHDEEITPEVTGAAV